MSRRTGPALAAGMVALAAQLLFVAASAATSARCAAEREPVDRWNAVSSPVQQVVSLVQLDDDPCDLVATDGSSVWVSDDGGSTWQPTFRALPGRAIARLFAEGMGPRTVVAALAAELVVDDGGQTDTGILVSWDAGRTFTAVRAAGIATMDVVAAAGLLSSGTTATERRQDVYLAAQVEPAGGVVYAGVLAPSYPSLSPRPGSSGWRPGRLAVDPVGRDVWASDVSRTADATRLWQSADGATTWSPVAVPAPGLVRDLTVGVARSGAEQASALVVAGDFGVLRSPDEGATWQILHGGTPAQGVRTEQDEPDTVIAIVDGRPMRGTAPDALRPIPAGLPEACTARDLARDAPTRGERTTFLLACGGSYYRYRAGAARVGEGASPLPTTSGSVPPTVLPPTVVPQPSGTPPGGAPLALPMTPLGTIDLPSTDGASGNIAFDGRTIYYTSGGAGSATSDRHIVVHRVTTATGAVQPDLVVPVGELAGHFDWIELSADVRRQLLYIRTLRGTEESDGRHYPRMLAYDLRTAAVSVLFDHFRDASDQRITGEGNRFSYDPSVDTFAAGEELGKSLRHYDRRGLPADDGCVFNLPNAGITGFTAAVVAAGDGGGAYVQMEDDSTLARVDRNCRLLAMYAHRVFSEPGMENDAMACDGVTFGVPAVWIRDAQLRSATAYAIPFGFCALPGGVAPNPKPKPGVVPVPPAPAPAPIPAPQPNPNPNPVQQPAPQPAPQVQAQPVAQAQPQPQVQQQIQQQSQQQAQAGLVRQRQEQHQVASVQVGAQSAQEQYATSRYRRRLPVPVPLGVGGLVLLGAYGALLSREWQVRSARA